MPFDMNPLLFAATPDSLVSDSPFDAILTGIPYCRGLPRAQASVESAGAQVKIRGDGQLGQVEVDLDSPTGATVREACQDLNNLVQLLQLKEAQHAALLRTLRANHDAVESISQMGVLRRFLHKRAGKTVDVVVLNMVMRELGDEHALMHDIYGEINQVAMNVALHIVLMVDGSLTLAAYQKYREDFKIARWTGFPLI